MKPFSKTIFTILLAFLMLTLNAQIYPTKTATRGAESTGSIVGKPLNYVDEKEAPLLSEQCIVTNTKVVGMAPRVYGNIIVFFTDEWMAQEDFNNDGKMDDLIVRCYNVSGQELINTKTVGHYPAIYENLITFTGWTVRYYNLSDRKTVDTGVLASVDIPSIFGSIIAFPTYETNAGRDLNGDGDLQDSVVMYFDLSKKKLVSTGIVGWGVSIYKDIIAFSTFEDQIAQDLNGDGDTSDSVVRYYNITSDTLVNTKAEGWWPSLNNNIIAFESHHITYTAISYYNISAGILVDTKVDGGMASVYGNIIAFQTPESDYGGDLNGDGDSNDWVIRYYNTSAGALVNTRAEGVNPSIHGNLIAFETSEQDDRVDLNNDGDTTDSVIRYLSLTAPTPPVVTLKTDKDVYVLGENVTITLTNVGQETVQIGGYPAWQIFTYPAEEPVYPKIFAFLAWSLDPGENGTLTWNQYDEFTESFAKPGTYVIKDTQGWGLSAYFETVMAEEQWIPYVPSPEQVDLVFRTENRTAYIDVKITFSDAGYEVSDWGTVAQDGYEIWVDSKIWEWTGPAPEVITPYSHTYDLGYLKEGNYTFTFKAWGISVESIVFTTPPPSHPQIKITGIRPPEGPPGVKGLIVGEGATPNGIIVALFENISDIVVTINNVSNSSNITLGWTIADKDGYWEIWFAVPSVPPGEYLVYVVDNTTQTSDSTIFVVTAAQFKIEYVSPQSGPVGTSVYLSGSGATPNGEVRIYFDETNVVNTTAKDWDRWSTSFEVPEVNLGNYTIMALDVTTNTRDTVSFAVTPPPTIRVSPTEAPIGSKISIAGEGFTPKQSIFITFEDLLLLSPITTDENGEFNVTLFVPMVNSGNYTIKATIVYPYQVAIANVSFTVTLGIDTLFREFANLKSRYYDLKNDYEELDTEYNSLRSNLDSLNSTYNNSELNYTDLKSKYEALTADMANARDLSYTLLVSIIICIATIAYLAIKKPKAKL